MILVLPLCPTRALSLSQLAQLPFSWGELIFALCTLGNISGEPQGRATSCQDYTASERTTEAGFGVPGDLWEQGTCARIVTAVMSIVTSWKHPKCWSIGKHLNKLRYIHTMIQHILAYRHISGRIYNKLWFVLIFAKQYWKLEKGFFNQFYKYKIMWILRWTLNQCLKPTHYLKESDTHLT